MSGINHAYDTLRYALAEFFRSGGEPSVVARMAREEFNKTQPAHDPDCPHPRCNPAF